MKCPELIPNLIHAVGKVLADEGAPFRIKHAELTEAYNALLEPAAVERGIQIVAGGKVTTENT